MFGQFVEVVELGPGEDALTVGLRSRQLARMGTDGEEDRRGLECVFGAAGFDDVDLVASGQGRLALDSFHAGADEAFVDVVGLSVGEREDTLVDRFEVGGDSARIGFGVRGVLDPDTEPAGALDLIHHLSGGDERLRRHDIGEHGGTTTPILLDEHDIGTELSRDERSFVAAGAAADDDDAICSGFKFSVHTVIVSNPHVACERHPRDQQRHLRDQFGAGLISSVRSARVDHLGGVLVQGRQVHIGLCVLPDLLHSFVGHLPAHLRGDAGDQGPGGDLRVFEDDGACGDE